MGKVEINRRGALGLGVGALSAGALGTGGLLWAETAASAASTALDASRIDAIVQTFMSAFEIPGVGVAIIRPDEAPYVRGYGVRTLGKPEPVDTNTLFAIASNSKAFTSAALAILVDQGKIGWDEPVIKHMPDFAMHDPVATQMMTVRDLLVHRSGLGAHAGDLMIFPRNDHSAEEIFRAVRHFPLVRGFRAGYAYDNILYIVAGILIERVSGLSWQDFIARNILHPLGMKNAAPSLQLVRTTNVAGRHIRLGPPALKAEAVVIVEPDETSAIDAAGGINASVADIVPWLQTQLGKGQAAGLPRLWSEAQSVEMWNPQVITSSTTGPDETNPIRPILSGYALGWYVQDYRGRRLIAHSGQLTGQITYTAFLPEQGIGLAVYSNTEDGMPVTYLRNALLDILAGAPPFDWVQFTHNQIEKNRAESQSTMVEEAQVPPGGPSLPLAAYAGRYRDAWYGDIVVTLNSGKLAIDFTRTPVFKSILEPWGVDTFRTRWADNGYENTVVSFTISAGVVTGMKLKALSPTAHPAYDYHSFDPKRV